MRRRKSFPGVTPELFTRLYMESWKAGHTVREFADRIGLPPVNVHSRVRYYRKRGAHLPDLRPASAGRPPASTALPISLMNRIVDNAMPVKASVPDFLRPALANGRP